MLLLPGQQLRPCELQACGPRSHPLISLWSQHDFGPLPASPCSTSRGSHGIHPSSGSSFLRRTPVPRQVWIKRIACFYPVDPYYVRFIFWLSQKEQKERRVKDVPPADGSTPRTRAALAPHLTQPPSWPGPQCACVWAPRVGQEGKCLEVKDSVTETRCVCIIQSGERGVGLKIWGKE